MDATTIHVLYKIQKGHIFRERRLTLYWLLGELEYDTHGLHGREPGDIRERWGPKGTHEVAAEGPITWYKKENPRKINYDDDDL